MPKLEKQLIANYFETNEREDRAELSELILALQKLTIAREEELERKRKLKNSKAISNLWEYLNLYITERSIEVDDICEKCQIEKSFLFELLQNKIRITDINPQKIAQLTKFLQLKIEIVKELLIKTIWLSSNQKTAINALARYDKSKGLVQKDRSMKNAVNELLFKANRHKHFINSDNIDKVINRYLEEFEEFYKEI